MLKKLFDIYQTEVSFFKKGHFFHRHHYKMSQCTFKNDKFEIYPETCRCGKKQEVIFVKNKDGETIRILIKDPETGKLIGL